MRFNPPPNWPVPPGWSPGPGWQPNPEWGPPPYGWQLWVPDGTAAVRPSGQVARRTANRSPVDAAAHDASPSTQPGPAPETTDHPKPKKKVWTKAVENPLWTTVGALVGIVGLVLSSIQIFQALQTPPVDLEVAAVTIDGQQSAQGEVDGDEKTFALTPIELTLQNKGGEPSLITQIDAEVIYFQQLADCTGAKPARDTLVGPYALAIPMDGAAPSEKKFSNQIRFEVKPGAADRMVLTFGPAAQPAFATTPMVMSVRLKLVHDDDSTMDVGTVSVATTVEAATAQIDGLGDAKNAGGCAKENLEHLDEQFAIQATRSRLLESLRSAYQGAAS